MAPLVCQTSICARVLLWALKLIHFYMSERGGEREESRVKSREGGTEGRRKGGMKISLIFNFVFPHTESLAGH